MPTNIGEVVNVYDALRILQWLLGGRMQMVLLENSLLEENKVCNWFTKTRHSFSE